MVKASMTLKITSINGSFYLAGVLSNSTAPILITEPCKEFNLFNHLTVNVEALNIIDSEGVNALYKLHCMALKLHKQFAIVGVGCKELQDHFKSCTAA